MAIKESQKMQLLQELLRHDGDNRNNKNFTYDSDQETARESRHFKDGRGDGIEDIRNLNRSYRSAILSQNKLEGLYSTKVVTGVDRKFLSKDRFHRFRKKRRCYSKTKTAEKATEKRLGKLETEVSWIYSESSWSEESDQGEFRSENNKMSSTKSSSLHPINEAFRDHVVKELLKQGKDLVWYARGVRRAADITDRLPSGMPEVLQSDASLAREVSDFLIKSSGPDHRMDCQQKMGHRRKNETKVQSKQCHQSKRKLRVKKIYT